MEDTPVQLFRLSDELWSRIEPLVPPMKWKPGSRGKRPAPDRACMDAIFHILPTGMHWKALPREYGASSTVHDRFQYWREKGLFELLWMESLGEFDAKVGIDWDWQSRDGLMVNAPLAGKKGTQPHRPREVRHEAQLHRVGPEAQPKSNASVPMASVHPIAVDVRPVAVQVCVRSTASAFRLSCTIARQRLQDSCSG